MARPRRVLVIEDDEHKRQRLVEHLGEILPADSLGEAKSLQSGIRSLLQESWELAILDMSMPTFDIGPDEAGGRPQVYAGREILRQMRRKSIRTPVLMVTQFDEFGEGTDALRLDQLDAQLHQEFPDTYRGSIYYDVVSDDWRKALTSRVFEVLGDPAP